MLTDLVCSLIIVLKELIKTISITKEEIRNLEEEKESIKEEISSLSDLISLGGDEVEYCILAGFPEMALKYYIEQEDHISQSNELKKKMNIINEKIKVKEKDLERLISRKEDRMLFLERALEKGL